MVSPAFNNSIGGKIAHTEVLTGCAVGSTPTLTLGADGSAKLGSVSYTGNQISVVTDKTFDIPAFDGSRFSSVNWTTGVTKPFVPDIGALTFEFDGSYKTKTVGATKADGSAPTLCSR